VQWVNDLYVAILHAVTSHRTFEDIIILKNISHILNQYVPTKYIIVLKGAYYFSLFLHICMFLLTNHSHRDLHEYFIGGRQIVHLVYSEYRYQQVYIKIYM